MPLKGQAKRDYDNNRVKERRRRWIESQGGKCVRCGDTEKLEVDHVDPKLKVSHRVFSWSEQRMLEELAKCQLLCVSCHRKKTRKDYEPSHGTHSRYSHRGCRCDLCKAAHAQLASETRKRGMKW